MVTPPCSGSCGCLVEPSEADRRTILLTSWRSLGGWPDSPAPRGRPGLEFPVVEQGMRPVGRGGCGEGVGEVGVAGQCVGAAMSLQCSIQGGLPLPGVAMGAVALGCMHWIALFKSYGPCITSLPRGSTSSKKRGVPLWGAPVDCQFGVER